MNAAVVLEFPWRERLRGGYCKTCHPHTVPDFRNENQVCGREVFRAVESTRLKGGERRNSLGRGRPRNTEHSGMTFKSTLTLSIQPLDKH